MDKKTKQRIEKIAKRFNSYQIFKPGIYPNQEKEATRKFKKYADVDIKFLLNLIVSLRPELENIKWFIQ